MEIKRIKIVDREKQMPRSLKLKVPFSGYTRRRFRAKAITNNGEAVLLSNVIWTLSPQVKGMSIDQDGLLTITPTVEAGTFYIIAKYAEDSNKYGIMKIKTIPAQGRDMPPNPIEKEGWELFAHDEFDAGALNRSIWSEQYLRNWSDDVGSKANYVLEDDKLIVKADSDSDKWSPYEYPALLLLKKPICTDLVPIKMNSAGSSRLLMAWQQSMVILKYGLSYQIQVMAVM